jgi:hypothetical protein
VREEGLEVVGVVAILDRLAGGADAIREAADGAPFTALTTIDDVYPERPDSGGDDGGVGPVPGPGHPEEAPDAPPPEPEPEPGDDAR